MLGPAMMVPQPCLRLYSKQRPPHTRLAPTRLLHWTTHKVTWLLFRNPLRQICAGLPCARYHKVRSKPCRRMTLSRLTRRRRPRGLLWRALADLLTQLAKALNKQRNKEQTRTKKSYLCRRPRRVRAPLRPTCRRFSSHRHRPPRRDHAMFRYPKSRRIRTQVGSRTHQPRLPGQLQQPCPST